MTQRDPEKVFLRHLPVSLYRSLMQRTMDRLNIDYDSQAATYLRNRHRYPNEF